MPGKGRPIKKGQVLNPKGRTKGSLNKSTLEIREFIQKVVSNNLESLEIDLSLMSPAARWGTLEKLSKYFMPALQKNEVSGEIDSNITIKITYEDKDLDKNDEDD